MVENTVLLFKDIITNVEISGISLIIFSAR